MTASGAMIVFSSSQMCAGKYAILSVVNPSVTIEMKDDMELSKKAQLDLSSAAEPVKLFDKPAARPPYDAFWKCSICREESNSEEQAWLEISCTV